MLSFDEIKAAIPDALQTADISGLGEKQSGKVRDIYTVGDTRILIATDRISAFDRILGHVPFRGQILNQLAAWWFGETADIVPNHVIEVPDPNVTVAREAEPIPVEVVVRGYITGVTSTSLWTLYEQGERTPYGIPLPDGLEKNDPLPHPVITPTTKAQSGHDERLSRAELLEHGMVPEARWRAIEEAALALFDRGRERAIAGGLILVDTKYEFGLIDGDLYLIDEVHTPDSSRYWTASSHAAGDPDHMDKEFMRKWFVTAGYQGEGDPPAMPNDLIAMIASRYMGVYERLTGMDFVPGEQPAADRIAANLSGYRS